MRRRGFTQGVVVRGEDVSSDEGEPSSSPTKAPPAESAEVVVPNPVFEEAPRPEVSCAVDDNAGAESACTVAETVQEPEPVAPQIRKKKEVQHKKKPLVVRRFEVEGEEDVFGGTSPRQRPAPDAPDAIAVDQSRPLTTVSEHPVQPNAPQLTVDSLEYQGKDDQGEQQQGCEPEPSIDYVEELEHLLTQNKRTAPSLPHETGDATAGIWPQRFSQFMPEITQTTYVTTPIATWYCRSVEDTKKAYVGGVLRAVGEVQHRQAASTTRISAALLQCQHNMASFREIGETLCAAINQLQ